MPRVVRSSMKASIGSMPGGVAGGGAGGGLGGAAPGAPGAPARPAPPRPPAGPPRRLAPMIPSLTPRTVDRSASDRCWPKSTVVGAAAAAHRLAVASFPKSRLEYIELPRLASSSFMAFQPRHLAMAPAHAHNRYIRRR